MQHLTPVGLSKDGKQLLLISTSGEEFAVPVDTRLRAALRGDNARLGQLEMKMESALRPRDIQARIRAGESPEDVATAAQTTVEAIMGFATPVLAERAHVAQTAQKASVRRRSGESSSSGRILGEVAEAFFSSHSLYDQDVTWDAWRRSDGRWALVAEYAVDGKPRRAEFVHDLPGRFVVADNDEAKVLTGEIAAPGREGQRAGAGGAQSGRRLSSVPASQDELPLGDDAIELVREGAEAPDADEPAAPSEESADPGTESVASAPAAATPPLDLTAETADADWLVDAPPAAQKSAQRSAQRSVQEPATPVAEPEAEPAATAGSDDTSAEEAEEAGEPPSAPAKKKGRSSVPSWDEIMFGGGKAD